MSPKRKRGQFSNEEMRYLRNLPVLLRGTDKSVHDRDVQVHTHFTMYAEDSPAGSFKKGDIHQKHPSEWYAKVSSQLARRFGYDLEVITEEEYERRNEGKKQGTQGTRKGAKK